MPEQRERVKVYEPMDILATKRFAPLKEFKGNISIVKKFSERQYEVDAGKPIVFGVRQHFVDNLKSKSDRADLNIEKAQDIINNSRLTLYQTDKRSLKFIADKGYVVINMKSEIVTAVPEKMRNKYKKYLEGK